jgi:plastocyanin
MRNRNRLWILVGLMMVLVVLAAACGGGDNSTVASASGSGSATATTVAKSESDEAYVEIKGFKFTPPDSVKAGSKVEVRNEDSATHTVTADDGSFDTKDVSAGGEASFTAPSTPGTYKFHCSIHPSMTSELVGTAWPPTAPQAASRVVGADGDLAELRAGSQSLEGLGIRVEALDDGVDRDR